jgi:hypothetical protein
MLRFVLPAFIVVSALLVLFAGALGDLNSLPDLPNRLISVVTDTTAPANDTAPASDTTRRPTAAMNRSPAAAPTAPTQSAAQQNAAQQAAHDKLEQQVSELRQQADALQTELTQSTQELARRTQEITQRNQELTQRDKELAQRAQELAQHTQQLDQQNKELAQRKQELEAARADADKLRQTVDGLHEQRQAEEATLARLKSQEKQVATAAQARPAPAKPQQPAAGPPAPQPAAQAAPAPEPAPPPARVAALPPLLMPPTQPVQVLAPQQLMTAREWLASGRTQDARRVLATVQTEMVFRPVTPDQPYAQGENLTATAVGDAIRWLDMGETGRALQSISRAIDTVSVSGERASAGPVYPAAAAPGYLPPQR